MAMTATGIPNGEERLRTSFALTTTRAMPNFIVGENGELSPPYSVAVEEILEQSRAVPFEKTQGHTYHDGVRRSKSRRDLQFDPHANQAEWKGQAR